MIFGITDIENHLVIKMKHNRNNIVNVSDVKNIVKDCLRDWVKKETENNVRVWFDKNHSVTDRYDEG